MYSNVIIGTGSACPLGLVNFSCNEYLTPLDIPGAPISVCPTGIKRHGRCSSAVEHSFRKAGVEGSNPSAGCECEPTGLGPDPAPYRRTGRRARHHAADWPGGLGCAGEAVRERHAATANGGRARSAPWAPAWLSQRPPDLSGHAVGIETGRMASLPIGLGLFLLTPSADRPAYTASPEAARSGGGVATIRRRVSSMVSIRQ